MILDEAANYPLPSLPSLMSEGGGTGITTMVVLQSLAQARAVWGEHEASAIWDAASVKLILGGGSNARDLEDLSKLIGQREEQQFTQSFGPDGRRSDFLVLARGPGHGLLPAADAAIRDRGPDAARRRAWRRKNKLDTDCHEDFASQLADVLEFVDPIFTRLVPDESTWDPNAYRWS